MARPTPTLTALLAAAAAALLGAAPARAELAASEAARFESEFSLQHRAPDRAFDLTHRRLELQIDFERASLSGEATLSLRAIGTARSELTLHAVELAIESVSVAGHSVTYRTEPALLRIALPRPYAPDEELVVGIRYAARPRLGLYFVPAEKGRAAQVWSQGESEENRHWFPSWDYPDDVATTEILVTVPAGFTTIANGTLVSKTAGPDGTETHHWLERQPHVNYLVSLIAGEFSRLDASYRDIALSYYVPVGREQDAERSFGATPDMLRVFEERFGHPYPFAKYAQTTVRDFRWGGMENASATTLTELTLHDEAAHLTYSSDSLVAHELAHQWFGDLVTCRSWRHIWLNESFATFAELVYFEARWGEEGLVDRALAFREGYLEEFAERYRRAIVTDVYPEPDDLFDAHAYEKGALVIQMLRKLLGEDSFWAGIRGYLAAHAGQPVETAELRIAFEKASGRDLDWFFEQWIFKAGHPQLRVSWAWDETASEAIVRVDQIQKIDDLTPIFATPIDIRLSGPDGERTLEVRLEREHEVFHIPAAARPSVVELDPERWLLAEIEFEKPFEEWPMQLAEGHAAMSRVAAAEALGSFAGEPRAAEALGRALRDDASRHVRGAAAASLGKLATEAALGELEKGLGEADARVRRQLASALGEHKSARAAALLGRLIDTDPSPYVVADAAAALGETGDASALKRLVKLTQRDSHDEAIRRGAYVGLAALGDVAALEPLRAGTRPGVAWRARAKAIEGLGKLAAKLPAEREAIRTLLMQLVADSHFDARRTTAAALGETEDREALPFLRALAASAYEPGVRGNAHAAVRQILAAGEASTAAELASRVDKLEKTSGELRNELGELRRQRDSEGKR